MLLDQDFDLLSEITDIETIARGTGVRIRQYLNQSYGQGRWRKLKGRAWIRIKRSKKFNMRSYIGLKRMALGVAI